MGFAVELYFDTDSENRLRQLWTTLAAAGISFPDAAANSRPHISLATFQKADTATLTSGIAEFAKRTSPFELDLSSVGSFPTAEGVVFLAPIVTSELLNLHKQFHNWLNEAGLVCHHFYTPGNWMPHCTVTFHLKTNQIGTAVAVCHQYEGVYGRVQIEAIGLVKYPSVEALATFSLSNP